MQHCDRELEALLDAERQAVGASVDKGLEIIAFQQVLDPARDLPRRQVIELSVELEILLDRQLAVE